MKMYLNCVIIIVLATTIESSKSVLADKGKFDPVKPSPIDELPEERRLINFKDPVDEKHIDHHRSEKEINEESDKSRNNKQEKKTRTFLTSPSLPDSTDNSNCCGSKYDGSPGRPEPDRGSSSGLRGSSDPGRYSTRYGIRPEDRYGWQSYTPGSTGRRGTVSSSSSGSGSNYGGGGGLYGNNQSGGDRHGTRPPYYGGDNEYDRPSNSGNRPGRPSYGYGYGDNGAYGSNGYEVSRPGGYGSNRPSTGGINFGGSRPGIGTYGGGSYGGGTYGGGGGSGGHGIYANIGEDGEFPGQDGDAGPEGPPSPGVTNLQTQKAVALKALAGVALIGAAAALASNPVLLPIGVLAGRKKRDIDSSVIDDIDVVRLIKVVEDAVPKIYREKINQEVLNSPTCVARLACEVQKEFMAQQKKNNTDDKEALDNIYNSLKRRLMNLMQSKILHADTRYKNIRLLVKSAEIYDGNCNVFVCDFMKDS